MLHFFPTFSRRAADTPFGQALRDLNLPHRIFAGEVRSRYRRRAYLFLACIPKLALFALSSAVASLLLARPVPNAVVLGSDVEVVIFALARILFHRSRVKIVLSSFIFTSRSKGYVNTLRRRYFAAVLGLTDLAIVHSQLELERYRRIFPERQFAFVPWGTNIEIRQQLFAEAEQRQEAPLTYIVTAGRSGRDYTTLFAAATDLPTELRVICDSLDVLGKAPRPTTCRVLGNCYGNDYVRQLFDAAVVVVPLAVEDISAGQMVMIQAMGLGKAVVVTRTPTICDYVQDGEDALLVEPGDAAGLRAAIQRLLDDPVLRHRLGCNAMARYDRSYSTKGHLRRIVELTNALPPRTAVVKDRRRWLRSGTQRR
jgi:glycosyltransferase involved in cell wall biosynthesis